MTAPEYSKAPKNLIFSGIQPTGALTIGNYLGAIRNWVNLQDNYECIYCLVDQHALTVDLDGVSLLEKCRAGAAALLACGIDPKRHILMVQSHNPDHAELAWYFNCTARMGWLNRMTQFKDKAGKNRERASTGLFIYPNLMSADILAYRASHVPVGDDQKQHLELARDIALKFNHDWQVEDFFPLIEPLIMPEASRIMSLRDGTKKMAKSDPSDQSRINISDDADIIAQKIRKAKTDPHPLPDHIEGLEGRPEALNLLTIYAALEQRPLTDIVNEFSGLNFSEFKKKLADLTVSYFAPITAEYNHYMAAPDELDKILRIGGQRARAISAPILKDVRHIMGLMPS